MATAPKFCMDVNIHNLLMHFAAEPVEVPPAKVVKPPVFPRFPNRMKGGARSFED